jgi:hypothetical protein
MRDLVFFVSVVGVHPNSEMGSISHLLLDGFSGRNAPHSLLYQGTWYTPSCAAKVHTRSLQVSPTGALHVRVVSTENKA